MEIRSSIVVLQPGMYVLRHPQTGLPPLTVTRAPGNLATQMGKSEVLSTPNSHGSILRTGADCIVMHVYDGPIEILVTAYLKEAGAAMPSLKVDRIPLEGDGGALAAVAGKSNMEIADKGISIIGHLERSGDVVASEGKAIGSPSSTLRIEGFQIMWPDKPEGVDLAYNIEVEGVGVTPLVNTGKFCGTRGQARRITEATFVLTGPKAAQYQLEGTASFTGGFSVPINSGLPNSGPSGVEHLTSLSLRVVAADKAKPQPNPWDASAKTKVFKAPAKAAPVKSTSKPAKPVAHESSAPAEAAAKKRSITPAKSAAKKSVTTPAKSAVKRSSTVPAKSVAQKSTKPLKSAKK